MAKTRNKRRVASGVAVAGVAAGGLYLGRKLLMARAIGKGTRGMVQHAMKQQPEFLKATAKRHARNKERKRLGKAYKEYLARVTAERKKKSIMGIPTDVKSNKKAAKKYSNGKFKMKDNFVDLSGAGF